MSVIVTSVAAIGALLVTSIVKLMSPNTSMDSMLAVLITVILIGTTFTVSLSLTTVVFSFEVTLTTFVQLPVALVLAVTTNLMELPLTNSAIFHVINVLPSANVSFSAIKSAISDSIPTSTKPAGK